MTTVEVESNKPLLQCRDCPFNTMSAQEFSDHVEVCPVNPVVHNRELAEVVEKMEVEEGGEG